MQMVHTAGLHRRCGTCFLGDSSTVVNVCQRMNGDERPDDSSKHSPTVHLTSDTDPRQHLASTADMCVCRKRVKPMAVLMPVQSTD